LLHVHLKLVGPGHSLHESSLFSRRLHTMCPIAHTSWLDHAQTHSGPETQASAQSSVPPP
jgi:hypothetical protein